MSTVIIGNFDGVHLGHQGLIQKAVEMAKKYGETAIVLTFDPHPARILAPERVIPLLLTLDRKRELLLELGVDHVIAQGFDQAFAQKSPREFVQDVLVPLQASTVFVGTDFCFGSKRQGTIDTLRELGQEFGFMTHATPLTEQGKDVISSSRVRQHLSEGDLAAVHKLLGRPFDFDGLVVKGDQRGRTIGFPTANLLTHSEALPKQGVYAVRVRWSDEGTLCSANGMMNIGVRPTIEAGGTARRSIEVHLFDFNQDLYGKTLRVECVERLRDEQRFENIEALRAQLQRDELAGRAVLS